MRVKTEDLINKFEALFGNSSARLMVHKPNGKRIFTVSNIPGVASMAMTRTQFEYWLEGASDMIKHGLATRSAYR